jgi:hypothetical protein
MERTSAVEAARQRTASRKFLEQQVLPAELVDKG